MNEQVAPNGLIFLSHKHCPFETASLPPLMLLQKALQHFQWKPVFWQNRELPFFFFFTTFAVGLQHSGAPLCEEGVNF